MAQAQFAHADAVTSLQEENGITVPQVVIVDMATGTESVGTRRGTDWTGAVRLLGGMR